MKYRPDIDGLRAFAIIPVLIFHAGYPLKGGFTGVDIFFVISGYLISSIIKENIKNNSYSIVVFYAKRFARIFPALFSVYFFVFILTAFFGTTIESKETSSSLSGSILFISNIYFSQKNGYFDSAIQENPLLHTWSLSVEEQFYLLLPLILHISKKFNLKLNLVLIFLVFFSFSLSFYSVIKSPSSAYYMFLVRAWEMGVGSLLANNYEKINFDEQQSSKISFFGLSLLIVSVIFINKNTIFPSIGAIPSVAGAALIIIGGKSNNTIKYFLSKNIFIFIGKISYSLYLWHWPIIVLINQNFGKSKILSLLAILISLIISIISWRFIETPARNILNNKNPGKTISYGLCASFLFLIASNSLPIINKFIIGNEKIKRIDLILSKSTPNHFAFMREGTCFLTSKFNSLEYYKSDICLRIDEKKENVLLIGDSHSAQFYEPLTKVFPEKNFLQASASGCLPGKDISGEKRCLDLITNTIDKYTNEKNVQNFIISGRWDKNSIEKLINLSNDLSFKNKNIIILGPNTEYSSALPNIIAKSIIYNSDRIIKANERNNQKDIDNLLINKTKHHAIKYISYFQTMCNPDCPIYASDGSPALLDDNHLSEIAATDFLTKSKHEFIFANSQ